MKLGAFSISLSVQDIHKSSQFYKALGFEEFGGNIDDKWLILKQGTTVIGLFEGMFESNILTFNPAWDQQANLVDPFDDIRDIEQTLQQQGIPLTKPTEKAKDPDSFILEDPDGTIIKFDQYR